EAADRDQVGCGIRERCEWRRKAQHCGEQQQAAGHSRGDGRGRHSGLLGVRVCGATAAEPHVETEASRSELQNGYERVTTSSRIDERLGGVRERRGRAVDFCRRAPNFYPIPLTCFFRGL